MSVYKILDFLKTKNFDEDFTFPIRNITLYQSAIKMVKYKKN